MPTITPTRDFLFRQVPDLGDDELEELVAGQAEALQGLLDDLRSRLAEIEEDETLSQEGRKEARREAVQELRETARVVGRVSRTSKLRERVRSEREALRDPDFRLSEEE